MHRHNQQGGGGKCGGKGCVRKTRERERGERGRREREGERGREGEKDRGRKG